MWHEDKLQEKRPKTLSYVDDVYYRSSLNKLGKVDVIIQKGGELESQWKDINTAKQRNCKYIQLHLHG